MQIVAVLHHGKSSYLAPFLSLRDIILKEAAVAEDNLKFLHCLEEPCQLLAKSSPQVRVLALLRALCSPAAGMHYESPNRMGPAMACMPYWQCSQGLLRS